MKKVFCLFLLIMSIGSLYAQRTVVPSYSADESSGFYVPGSSIGPHWGEMCLGSLRISCTPNDGYIHINLSKYAVAGASFRAFSPFGSFTSGGASITFTPIHSRILHESYSMKDGFISDDIIELFENNQYGRKYFRLRISFVGYKNPHQL